MTVASSVLTRRDWECEPTLPHTDQQELVLISLKCHVVCSSTATTWRPPPQRQPIQSTWLWILYFTFFLPVNLASNHLLYHIRFLKKNHYTAVILRCVSVPPPPGAVAQGGRQDLGMSLKPPQCRTKLWPFSWHLGRPFTHGFLLLYAGISHQLFLKLPICSGPSWDRGMFCTSFSLLIFFVISPDESFSFSWRLKNSLALLVITSCVLALTFSNLNPIYFILSLLLFFVCWVSSALHQLCQRLLVQHFLKALACVAPYPQLGGTQLLSTDLTSSRCQSPFMSLENN